MSQVYYDFGADRHLSKFRQQEPTAAGNQIKSNLERCMLGKGDCVVFNVICLTRA